MKKLVEKETIFLLKACYKDNDDEELGAFDSMEALTTFFARTILADHKNEDPAAVMDLIATKTAELCGQGDADECIDGCTRYWIHEENVMSLIDVRDEEKEKPEKKGRKK